MIKALLGAVLAAAVVMPGFAYAEGPACNSLVITGHPAYPPVAWDANGAIVGAAPNLVSELAKQAGVKKVVSKDFGPWDKAQLAAKSGRADVIFGIYKNDERQTYLNYIDPAFMLDPVSVIVRKGESFAFAEWSDLKGRKGVTNEGESYGNKFDAFMDKELTVARVHGVDKAFQALLQKKADYLIIGLYPGQNIVKKQGITNKVEFLPKEIDAAQMFIAFSKKSKCYETLKDAFAKGIQADIDSGRIKTLLEAARKAYH